MSFQVKLAEWIRLTEKTDDSEPQPDENQYTRSLFVDNVPNDVARYHGGNGTKYTAQ